ncbi:MAG: sugar phosphate nucleotidyltransferase [Patescibacteria group bacterium]
MLRGFLNKIFGRSSKKLSDSSLYKEHLYALVLAGGGGTRLWPKSREKSPKQFLPLFNKETLTQITLKRLNKILPWEKIFVVTVSEEYKKEILKEVPDVLSKNILVEPARRETGPAHGLGALYIHSKDPDAVIVTEAADRLVKPVADYLNTLSEAAKVAYEHKILIAMGVEARYPNTGYGHIKRGDKWGEVNGIKFFKLEQFVEKPPLELAKKYTSSGNYYWNAGQFVWRADTLLDSLEKHSPEIAKKLDEIRPWLGTDKENAFLKKVYESMPKIAIDYAVAEKDKNFLVVFGDFHWTDIGDWKEIWENLPKDESSNVIIDGDSPGGRVINIDTSETLVHTDGRLIAMVDVDDIAIVDTKDILLICKKSRAQSVKKIVELLKKEKKLELL